MEEEKTVKDTLKDEVEKILCDISEMGINEGNIEYVYKLIDVHKDICNENYWKEKIENMRYSRGSYGTYGNYGDGSYGRRSRDSRGRYTESGRSYGGRYRGDDYMDEMSESYGRYMDGHSRYGADQESEKSLEHMMRSAYDFVKHLSDEAQSQGEMEIVREYARKIAEI